VQGEAFYAQVSGARLADTHTDDAEKTFSDAMRTTARADDRTRERQNREHEE